MRHFNKIILVLLFCLTSFCALAQDHVRTEFTIPINFKYYSSKDTLISCIPNKGTKWEKQVIDAFINYHADFFRTKNKGFDTFITKKWMASTHTFYAPKPQEELKIYRIELNKFNKLIPISNNKIIDIYLYFAVLYSEVGIKSRHFVLQNNQDYVVPFAIFTETAFDSMFLSSNVNLLEENCALEFSHSAIGFTFRTVLGPLIFFYSTLDSLENFDPLSPYRKSPEDFFYFSHYRYSSTDIDRYEEISKKQKHYIEKKYVPNYYRKFINTRNAKSSIRTSYFYSLADYREDSLFDPSMIPIQLIHLQEKKQGLGKYFTINHRLSLVFDTEGTFIHATRGPMMPTVMKEDAKLQNLLIGDTSTMVYREIPEGAKQPVTKKLNKEAYDQFEELFDSISEATAQSALNAKLGQKEPVLFSPAWLEKYATRVDINHFDK